MQSAKGSAVEAVTNTAAGFWVNFAANLLVLPLFGFTGLTVGKNVVIGIIYTGISLARGYLLRRFFNRLKLWNSV